VTQPTPRGPLSEALLTALRGAPGTPLPAGPPAVPDDPLGDDDLHLSLYCCYELAYRGLPGVDEGWEWDPGLVALRGAAERVFLDALRDAVPVPSMPGLPVDRALRALVDADDGPSLSRYLLDRGTPDEVREFMTHRSAYQLKEADPHSFGIPRLTGRAKAALVEIQFDEYGCGRPEDVHAELFRRAMVAVGLDDRYGAHLDALPGVTLATVNLMSLLGLHRRHRGALVGHLACFEMTSSEPNRRYGDALRRLGHGPEATRFFDEHVTADALHEQVAAVDLAGGLVADEPALRDDVLWGAAALIAVEERWARHLLAAWADGRSSLREPAGRPRALPVGAPATGR
jgi:hypothetical protein